MLVFVAMARRYTQLILRRMQLFYSHIQRHGQALNASSAHNPKRQPNQQQQHNNRRFETSRNKIEYAYEILHQPEEIFKAQKINGAFNFDLYIPSPVAWRTALSFIESHRKPTFQQRCANARKSHKIKENLQ